LSDLPPEKLSRKGFNYRLDQTWGHGGFQNKIAAQQRATWDRSSGYRATVQKFGKKYWLYTNRR